MRKLKLFFACLLMAVLSIGQVWGAAATVYTSNVTLSSATTDGSTASVKATNSKAAISSTNYDAVKLGSNGNAGNFYIEVPANTTTLTLHAAGWSGKANKLTLSTSATGVSISPSTAQDLTANSGVSGSSSTYTITPNNAKEFFTFTLTGVSAVSTIKLACTERCLIWGVNAETSGSTPSPTVSADPESVTNVGFAGVTDQTIDLTYENISDYETEVSVHPNADGTGTLSPAWLTASVSDADDYATVTYSVSANDGAARTAYIKVYTTDGDKEATTIIPVSQVKYSAPTGTFELFSGDIEEGDYLIVADGAGMNTTVSSSRLQYTALTLTGENYVNPDESVIWHIAESATAGYWTIYSGAESKYAAATGSNNQAQMLESGTDNKSLWEITHSEAVYTITNKSNSRFLKKNGTYGFGCYADGTVSLYKKQVAGQPKAPTFSVAGGNYESAQSVELSCETTGATIHYTIDGTTPTSASPTYSTALNISSTTTVKAIAIKDDIASTVASATYTIVIWQTVDEIWSSITSEGPTNANVWGYVSQANVGGYNNNYYISVDGSLTANQLEIYKGDNAGNTVAVGDKVHVNGDLTIFNEIKEFKQNTGVIVHYAAKGALQSVAIDGTPTKTEYAANETFDPAGLKVFGTYANGFVGEITDGITWGNDLTDGKVIESTTVHVTATVSEIASPAYDVPVTIAAKTLVSIAVGTDAYTIYTGEALPQPVVTATFSEGDPEDVSAFAVYDSESVFDTEVIDNPNPQTITVSYTFGGATQTATYTVSVQDYENADNAPYSVTEALHIITAAIGNVESAREIVVTGTVSVENISGNKNRYKISDGVNELLVYAGKGFNNADFTNANYPKVNDVVKVKGKVINYNSNTPEFASGKSYLLSQVRPATLAIENVASFEVGATDLTESDLDITTPSDGAITFVSGDETKATIVANAIHAVAAGTVTITANLAATENVDALNYAATSTTFSVTVVAPATKYAISFDGNGADGGDAPEAIADKAAGDNVTLPANSYTYTGHTFTGWKVYDENEDEVTVTANAFEMPASAVVIKAQWAEISVWATTYTSNLADVNNGGSIVKFYGEDTEYKAIKAGTGKAAGSTTITVPAQASKLHFHAYGWNGESVTLSITAPAGVTVSPASQAISSNTGISGSTSTYTLAEGSTPETDAYFAVNLSGNNDEIELTISATSGNRFVLFGVNQEGGVLPVLESIEISGDLSTKTGYKVGDALDLDGLTVEATYSLGGVAQSPVDITSDPELELTYDPLVEDQTEVTITASYKGQTDDITITGLDPVASADPKIYVSTLNINFASVEVGESVPAAETVTVTLTNVASVTATLGGTNADAFSVSPASLTESGDITISILANTDAAASYAATLTISDGEGGADDKTVNLSFEVTEPVTPEDPEVRKTWDLSIASYDANPTEEQVTWSATYVNMVVDKYNATTKANNYLGGDANSRTSSRFYQNSKLTITPNGKEITSVVFTATSENYANALNGSDWTNATAGVSGTTVTVTPTDGKNAIIAVVGGTCGFTAVQVNYKNIAPEPPVLNWEDGRTGLTAGNYYTICLPKKVTHFRGASIWDLKKRNTAGSEVYLEEAQLPFAAGTPFIIQATATTLDVVYEGDATSTPVENGALRGTLTAMTYEQLNAAGTHIYILKENAIRPIVSGNFLSANRAYIDYDELIEVSEAPTSVPGKKVRKMPMQPQTPTGLDELNAGDQPMKVMINGQFYILRGEKMYNANGQVVK